MVPRFGIVLWYGAPEELPAGWAICNGQTVTKTDGNGTVVTPDLRDKYAIGAGQTYTKGSAVGSKTTRSTTSTVGDHSHTGQTGNAGVHNHGGTQGTAITFDQMPAHSHGFGGISLVQGNAAGLYFPSATAVFAENKQTENSGNGQPHSHGVNNDGEHAHSLTTSGAGGHSHTVDVALLPESVALYYIMKI